MNEEQFQRPKIKILGCGGGGCNFPEHIISVIGNKLTEDCFIAMNTDQQSLSSSKAKVKVQLGPNGLGAGANPKVGREYAEFSEEQIKEAIGDTQLLIIFSCFGGGTGSGAAPVIAKIAKSMGVLVLGIITKPFAFEGTFRKKIAEEAIKEFSNHGDLTVIISNQLLFKVTNQNTSFRESFKIIDSMCATFVSAIIDIFDKNGLINLDYADVEATIRDKGIGLIGIGSSSNGKNSAIEAVEKALKNPLLEDVAMESATNALVHISGNDMSLDEVDIIMTKIREQLGENVNIIQGVNIVDQYEEQQSFLPQDSNNNFLSMPEVENDTEPRKWIRVMIIATGLTQFNTKEEEKTPTKQESFEKKEVEQVTKKSEKKEDDLKQTHRNLFSLLHKLQKKQDK